MSSAGPWRQRLPLRIARIQGDQLSISQHHSAGWVHSKRPGRDNTRQSRSNLCILNRMNPRIRLILPCSTTLRHANKGIMDNTSKLKDKYLAKHALWNWHDNSTIDIVDADNNVLIHLNEWQALVFFEADGSTTTERLIYSLLTTYKNLNEEDLRKTIVDSAEQLVFELNVVELRSEKDDLPYCFDLPLNKQDKQESYRALAKPIPPGRR